MISNTAVLFKRLGRESVMWMTTKLTISSAVCNT